MKPIECILSNLLIYTKIKKNKVPFIFQCYIPPPKKVNDISFGFTPGFNPVIPSLKHRYSRYMPTLSIMEILLILIKIYNNLPLALT